MRIRELSSRMGRTPALVVAFVFVLGLCRPADAYQQYGFRIGNRIVVVKWNRSPIRYYVTDRSAPNVTAAQFQAAIVRAFSTWQGVTTAVVTTSFAGYTAANADEDDGLSTLGFVNRPDLDRVLGSTSYLIDTVTGAIVESDIFFNSAFPWSVADGGQAGRFDLESIAVHEIGHFLGLGHSALGETELVGSGRRVIAAESVLFPIAFSTGNTSDRTLRADDIAGISDLYPATGFEQSTGTVDGVVKQDGQPVYGAHVVAFSPRNGKMVGNFTDDQGRFSIASLPPGLYVVRVEPVDDADLDSFFDEPADIDVGFRVTFFNRLVVVPAGGSSGSVEISVSRK